MPYIGNPIYQSAFVTDQFSGTGSQTAYTMSVAPAGTTNVLVVVSGVVQDPSTYGVVGNTLTFSTAPPSGTGNISCRYLGVPVTGVTSTAYRTKTEFTATAGQTTFTPPSYTVGYIDVFRNGVLLGSADYTASNGTTVVLATGATTGDLITTESFYVSSVLNAIPSVGGAINQNYLDVSGQGGTGAMTQPAGTTAQRPSSSANGYQRFNTTLNVPEVYNTQGWVQAGMYLTGSATIASGSAQTYIDIANCFNSTFQNYVVKFFVFQSTSGGNSLRMAYESTGASLSGGLFSGTAVFPQNFYWVMHYQQTTATGTNGNQGGTGSTELYPELMGTSDTNIGDGYVGTLNLYDSYANSIKYGDGQGTMINPTVYLEQFNFYSAAAMTGRGLRMWIGGSTGSGCNVYGTVKVYGVL